jgi:hypothetical protein
MNNFFGIPAEPVPAIPSGTIAMWKGSIATIPSGWVLCNGANGTPDLRDRFVACASIDVGGVAKTLVDGSDNVSGGSYHHFHYYDYDTYTADADGGGTTVDIEGVSAIELTETVPPFYALAFIMKV